MHIKRVGPDVVVFPRLDHVCCSRIRAGNFAPLRTNFELPLAKKGGFIESGCTIHLANDVDLRHVRGGRQKRARILSGVGQPSSSASSKRLPPNGASRQLSIDPIDPGWIPGLTLCRSLCCGQISPTGPDLPRSWRPNTPLSCAASPGRHCKLLGCLFRSV